MPKPYTVKFDPIKGPIKICNGPSHSRPVWLSIYKFYKRGPGPGGGKYPYRRRSHCKQCEGLYRRYHKNKRTLVPVSKVWRFVEEIYMRVGVFQTCEELQVSVAQFYNWRNKANWRMKKETARRAIVALARIRIEQGCSPEEAFRARKALQVDRANKTKSAA